jgi:hypothetical protein
MDSVRYFLAVFELVVLPPAAAIIFVVCFGLILFIRRLDRRIRGGR